MNILFLHQNFAGQFRHLAARLAADPRNRVVAICQPQAPRLASVPNTVVYQPPRVDASGIHPYLRGLEGAVRNGQAVARVLLQLRARGYIPDIVIAHPARGEALYVNDIYPDTRLLNLIEFYYHATGADGDFDPEYPLSLDARTRNALQLLDLEASDAGVSPTEWQKSVHPPQFQSAISEIHEGIDIGIAVPDAQATFGLPDGTDLKHGDEVGTYVARKLEPYRGFHQFMRAAQLICLRRPKAHILIVGGDDVSHGQRLPARTDLSPEAAGPSRHRPAARALPGPLAV